MKHYLLIDLGTGSTRAALVRADGEILAVSSFVNRYYRDEAYPDAQYFLPQEWQAEPCCWPRGTCRAPGDQVITPSPRPARQADRAPRRGGRAGLLRAAQHRQPRREFMEEIRDKGQIYEQLRQVGHGGFRAAKLLVSASVRVLRKDRHRAI